MFDALMLDVGGTFIKYGAMQDGNFCQEGQFPINEGGTAEEIQNALLTFLKENPAHKVVCCMPGPADYPTGTCMMKHKFAAIYGISLKAWLEERLPGTEVSFLHDGAAFILGEMTYGALKDCKCGAGIMLGTGLGFVLCKDGKLMMRTVRTPAKPLWSAKYRDGIAENYVSATGMRRRWTEKTGRTDDVREMSEMARAGNADAIELFEETGFMLGEMLSEHLKDWPVEKIAIGGQIAKSWDLFENGFRKACSIPARQAHHLKNAALWGDYAFAQQGEALFDIIED